MNEFIVFRSIVSSTFTVVAMIVLFSAQDSLSLGDLLITALFASLLTSWLVSFVKSPSQFLLALFERARYVIIVPLCVVLIFGLLIFKFLFIVFRLSFKAVMAVILWLIYLIFPIDLIPDILPFLGYVDDVFIFISIWIWVVSSAASLSLKESIDIMRPNTLFP